MTRHKALHTGLGTPSPLDRWINAMLRGLAMLVSHVARRFASRHPISAAECDGNCDRLPEANVVLDQHPEPTPAAASSQPTEALMVSSVAIATRPSNHEGVLTGAAPRGTPPLGKGRSDLRNANRGGDHFVPHPQLSLQRRHQSHPHEVTPTPTSLRESRTSPFQGEENTAPA
jgi:hypothetical protein